MTKFIEQMQALDNTDIENCLVEKCVFDYVKTNDDAALVHNSSMAVLTVPHTEWSSFSIGGAQRADVTFKAPAGHEGRVYEVFWKQALQDEECKSEKFQGSKTIEIEGGRILAKGNLV